MPSNNDLYRIEMYSLFTYPGSTYITEYFVIHFQIFLIQKSVLLLHQCRPVAQIAFYMSWKPRQCLSLHLLESFPLLIYFKVKVKALVTKSNHPRSHMVEREKQHLQVVH